MILSKVLLYYEGMTQDIEAIMRELTDTERRIVEFFLRQGGSAREIASALNVSERTVYKALYKYRKLARENGLDPSAFYLRGTLQLQTAPPPERAPIQPDVMESLKKDILREVTEILEKSVHEAVLSAFEELFAASNLRYRPLPTPPPYKNPLENVDHVVITRLVENLERLNYNFETLARKLDHLQSFDTAQRTGHSQVQVGDNGYSGENVLPSFVQNNPWIEVLQKRKY
ncbi:MAG: sigma factor-like helix-turn-helix DNA-binding protein [Infirmifilum sp.]